MKRLLPLFLMTVLSPALAATVTVKTGQTVHAGGGTLTLLEVMDTRCPPKARCLMSGSVSAGVMVTRGHTTRTVHVTLPGRAVITPLGTLKLVSATRQQPRKPQSLTFDLSR